MNIALILVCWIITGGFYNAVLRRVGFSYGGTPLFTVLYYSFSAVSLVLLEYYFGALGHREVHFLFGEVFVVLLAVALIVMPMDVMVIRTRKASLRPRLLASAISKYSDVLFQQLLFYLLVIFIHGLGVSLFWVVLIFLLLHTPLFFFMSFRVASIFIATSVVGGFIFAYLYIAYTENAFVFGAMIHILFYSILRFLALRSNGELLELTLKD